MSPTVWAGVTTAVTIDETTDETDETTGAIASDFGCEIRRPLKVEAASAVGKSSITFAAQIAPAVFVLISAAMFQTANGRDMRLGRNATSRIAAATLVELQRPA